ncbi:adenylate cyclase type 3-like isoform X2 [Paramacrobiotus metropolitanus]|uniref:adenylate cyclase type 3-like isoform X2 n=1 Tax=Paramacrobiotus metropolitanus TaxID=2943436 RepID=UPI002446284E|nr:adenylate cyclase type 3-like isoform X2 [Paramacrobiotus metropolitanus]
MASPSPSPGQEQLPLAGLSTAALSALDAERPMLPEKKHSLYAYAQQGIIHEEERLELKRSGLYRLLPTCLRVKFAERQQEALYEAYYTSQKQGDLVAFVVAALCLQLFCVIQYSTRGLDLHHRPAERAALVFLILAFLFNCVVVAVYKLQIVKLKEQRRFKQLFPLLVFAVQYTQFFLDLLTTHHPLLLSDAVSFQILFVYVTMTMLPLRLTVCSLLALLSSLALLIVQGVKGVVSFQETPSQLLQTSPDRQLCAAAVLYFGSWILGMIASFVSDKKQRRAFRQARVTIAMKLIMEQQSQEQERLLLAVLPKHIAGEIRTDLGAMVHGQFKKIYLTRYENVSILFADIVGFTALSSNCTAAELVKLLNKLIARFDKLSEKYHQLRIKILGDCYYCISGAPEPRSDHAVLCCHMGLAMVDAIRAVREETQSSVDMRVGIHTGSVLAGVMGQKQYAYDVYSKDTKLANAMESGGKPGRVHISATTMACMKGDEFEVEPGDGGSRNEDIRKSHLDTFLIVRTLKMYPEGTLDADKGRLSVQNEPALSTRRASQRPRNGPGHGVSSGEADFDNRLLQALIEREGATLKSKANYVTLSFNDAKLEQEYAAVREKLGPAVISANFFVLLVSCLAHGILWDMSLGTGVAYGLALLILLGISVVSWATVKRRVFPLGVVRLVQWTEEIPSIRLAWLLAAVLCGVVPELVDRVRCQRDEDRPSCEPPLFYIHLVTFLLLAITVLMQIGHLAKLLMMSGLVTLHCLLTTLVQQEVFDAVDRRTLSDEQYMAFLTKYAACCILVIILCALFWVNRHMEITSRLLFVWKNESDAQKTQVTELRRKNEELVSNILPPHVAKHFLGRNFTENDDPYSEHHSGVGVMFASMPNFSDFYTEEGVNNQGLECLRFLNEVISDYDELLDDARFEGAITKIKTIGPTYMVASGLTNAEVYDQLAGTSDTHRWRHLHLLVKFALAMQEKLKLINENSFNQFYLRIGINHGPISAGVIGVRKPHYDIWGNTVNVASRMESTGQPNSIQVTEETMLLLKQFGYRFESRGLVYVKGKGELATYCLLPPPDAAVPAPGGGPDADQQQLSSSNPQHANATGNSHTQPQQYRNSAAL